MAKKKKDIKLYNIMLPLWLLLFWPSPLWLVLIPINYIIDRLVLRWGLKGLENRGELCKKLTWKICLAGFLSDFIGAIVLFCVSILPELIWERTSTFMENLSYGVGFNPFDSILSFFIVILAIAVSGLAIYLIDKLILTKAGIDLERAKSAALKLALVTAPYLYLVPSAMLYTSV